MEEDVENEKDLNRPGRHLKATWDLITPSLSPSLVLNHTLTYAPPPPVPLPQPHSETNSREELAGKEKCLEREECGGSGLDLGRRMT